MHAWWDQIRPYSLGWVTARLPGGGLSVQLEVRQGEPGFELVGAG